MNGQSDGQVRVRPLRRRQFVSVGSSTKDFRGCPRPQGIFLAVRRQGTGPDHNNPPERTVCAP